MKLLYDLSSEGINNERIQAKLNSLSSIKEKNECCSELIEKKKLLMRLYNQCLQLKLKFEYDLNNTLKNLDKINKNTLRSKIAANLANEKKNKTLSKTITIRKQTKTKPVQIKSVKPKPKQTKKKGLKSSKKGNSKKSKRKTPWTRIISTPMYS